MKSFCLRVLAEFTKANQEEKTIQSYRNVENTIRLRLSLASSYLLQTYTLLLSPERDAYLPNMVNRRKESVCECILYK